VVLKIVFFDMGGTIETYRYDREWRIRHAYLIRDCLAKGGIKLDLTDEQLADTITRGIKAYHVWNMASRHEIPPVQIWKNYILKDFPIAEESLAPIAEELALIYEARGLKPEQARLLADQILENKESAVLTLAKEELGIDPEELGGSAWEAALTSFVLFTIGAIIPVIPFTFLSGMTAVFVSIGLSVLGLFGLGAIITLFTGKPVLFSGMRMVIFSVILVLIMIFARQGLMGTREFNWNWVCRKLGMGGRS